MPAPNDTRSWLSYLDTKDNPAKSDMLIATYSPRGRGRDLEVALIGPFVQLEPGGTQSTNLNRKRLETYGVPVVEQDYPDRTRPRHASPLQEFTPRWAAFLFGVAVIIDVERYDWWRDLFDLITHDIESQLAANAISRMDRTTGPTSYRLSSALEWAVDYFEREQVRLGEVYDRRERAW